MKSWLQDNGIEIYSIHNERKSVDIIEQLISSLLKLEQVHILTLISKVMIKISYLKLVIFDGDICKGYTPSWSEEEFFVKKS